ELSELTNLKKSNLQIINNDKELQKVFYSITDKIHAETDKTPKATKNELKCEISNKGHSNFAKPNTSHKLRENKTLSIPWFKLSIVCIGWLIMVVGIPAPIPDKVFGAVIGILMLSLAYSSPTIINELSDAILLFIFCPLLLLMGVSKFFNTSNT
ncbi:MAG TPA: hypothetical protein DCM02_12680, partial [Flavobacterium sp.]|nr:hypothetical protein [Flavobacterium sp.]